MLFSRGISTAFPKLGVFTLLLEVKLSVCAQFLAANFYAFERHHNQHYQGYL